MSKTRHDFLANIWQKYPEMPRGALRFGRVEQMRLGVQVLTDWKIKNLITSSDDNFKAGDILADGDLIALLPNQQLVLLAPNLTNRPVRDEKWNQAKKWYEFLTYIRQIFQQKRFQEVSTPCLVKCPGTEPSLEVFETYFEWESKKEKFFLPTSPELNIKKLLVEGAERVFEIAKVFRNAEKTMRHEPEFLMLEWYRSFSHLSNIKMDTIELIEQLADFFKVPRPLEVLSFTIPELFLKHCQFVLTPSTSLEELRNLAYSLNIDVQSAETIDDYFFLIFMEKIEFQWPKDRLVFVEKYPVYQAALARIGSDGWAERFEVYWNGLELGNAFHELNDPELQKLRAIEDLTKKEKYSKKQIELDHRFFEALNYGMPPSAGIAVGLERLFMALFQMNEINQIPDKTIF